MATTYDDRKVALDEIAERIQTNRKRLKQARQLVATAESDLSSMTTVYSEIVTDIDAAATANPDDDAFRHQKLDKDKLVAAFNTLETQATDIKNAIDGVS